MPGGFFGACVGLEIVIGDQVRACHTWIDSLTIPGGNLNLLPYLIFPELWPYHTWIDSLWGNLNLLPYNYHIQNFLSYDLTIPGLIYYYTWINYDLLLYDLLLYVDSLTIPGGNLNLLPCSIFPEL